MRMFVLALVVAVAACQQAQAPQSSESATAPSPAVTSSEPAEAGVWIFEGEQGSSGCLLKLEGAPLADYPKFHEAWVSPGCESAHSFLVVLSGWEEIEGGGVRLMGAEGSTMGEFKPDPASPGVLKAVVENDGKPYMLRRPQKS